MNKPIYPIAKMVCPVCNRFVVNHLPWDLLKCQESNPKWYYEMLNMCIPNFRNEEK